MSPSSSSQLPQHGVKRKKPPTFQHLPAQRAKKLKRSWVEVQKIKSKWKSEKRKEGIAAPRSQLEREMNAGAQNASDDSQAHDEAMFDASNVSDPERGEEGSGDETTGAEEAPIAPPEREAKRSKTKTPSRRQPSNNVQPDEEPSLRDLQKMAYSRSSLHTHKAGPLNRQKQVNHPRGRGGGNPGRGRGRGGGARDRGRGQPNMGLRMKAMLAKIKQDYS